MITGEWTLDEARFVLQLGGSDIELHPVRSDPILRLDRLPIQHAPDELAPSRFCLLEWQEYIVTGTASFGIPGQKVDTLSAGVFRFCFENQIGRANLHFGLPNRPSVILPVEVLSPKCPSPKEHLGFFQQLLNDLSQWAVQLPFTITAPTHLAVDESPAEPSPLFVYNFLLHNDEALREACQIILANPHQRLADEDRWRRITEVTEVDGDTILGMLTHPEFLTPVKDKGIACVVALQGHAPTHVYQHLLRASFDTTENRFVLACLNEFQREAEALRDQRWWKNVPSEKKTRVRELVCHLAEISDATMFDEVGCMMVFPAASQVLLRRDGYRELLQLWRLFQLARRPFYSSLQTAIELRDVATLYEFWCFFQLAEALSKELGCAPHYDLRVTDDKGLEYEASAELGRQGRLIFNRTFRRGQTESYSVSLRPDFTFVPGSDFVAHDQRVIFDAKFRFTTAIWQSEDGDTQARIAERADLYKMHTYRDALRARAAIALFPGDRSVFYDTEHKRTASELTLVEMLIAEGIGALNMRPQ